MREKLNSKTGGDIYRKRKTITEPVFGQLKEARRFRTFLLRGTEKVRGEWQLMAICHNLRILPLRFAQGQDDEFSQNKGFIPRQAGASAKNLFLIAAGKPFKGRSAA